MRIEIDDFSIEITNREKPISALETILKIASLPAISIAIEHLGHIVEAMANKEVLLATLQDMAKEVQDEALKNQEENEVAINEIEEEIDAEFIPESVSTIEKEETKE